MSYCVWVSRRQACVSGVQRKTGRRNSNARARGGPIFPLFARPASCSRAPLPLSLLTPDTRPRRLSDAFMVGRRVGFCVARLRGGSRGTVQGVGGRGGGGGAGGRPPPPPPRDDLRFSNKTGILQKKKTLWFIGVEVEQETSAPPPKKILDPPLRLAERNAKHVSLLSG